MKLLRIVMYLIIFVSIISTILPDELSKECVNFIIVCAISLIVINSVTDIKYSEYNFSVSDYLDEYVQQSEIFKSKVNLYFDDIRKVTGNEKHNNDN